MHWPGTELQQSEWFTDVRQSVQVLPETVELDVHVHLARRHH